MGTIILVTTDRRDGHPDEGTGPRVRPRRAQAWVGEPVIDAVRTAGGIPLLVPPGETSIEDLLAVADGVVITGGHFDIHPSLYGQAVSARLDRVEPSRTELELALARHCLLHEIPVLGICGGHQVLAVAAGGSLVQDIKSTHPDALEHEQPTDPAKPWHKVRLSGRAAEWLGVEVDVNSTHHQAVDDAGSLRVAGRSEDGIIEVIESRGPAFVLGVQWHPEVLDQPEPFDALVRACAQRRASVPAGPCSSTR